MFFNWGIKDKKLVDTVIDNALCPHCANNKYSVVSWASYLYIYWIPVYIRTRKLVIFCNKCKKTIKKDTIPEDFFKKIHILAYPTHKILPYFTGTFLILILLILSLYLHLNTKYKRSMYFSNPQVNDIYLVQIDKIVNERTKIYRFLKLNSIKPHVLEFKTSKQSFNKYYEATNYLYNSNAFQNFFYTEDILSITKTKLIEYEKNGVIEKIRRRNQ